MNIKNLRITLIAGLSILSMFISTQSTAQSAPTWKTSPAGGKCTVHNVSGGGIGGTYYRNPHVISGGTKKGRTSVYCPIDTSSNGFQRLNVAFYKHPYNPEDKAVCKVVYNNRFGKYRTASYQYVNKNYNSYLTFLRPEYVDSYKSIYLHCWITSYDQIFSISTYDSH